MIETTLQDQLKSDYENTLPAANLIPDIHFDSEQTTKHQLSFVSKLGRLATAKFTSLTNNLNTSAVKGAVRFTAIAQELTPLGVMTAGAVDGATGSAALAALAAAAVTEASEIVALKNLVGMVKDSSLKPDSWIGKRYLNRSEPPTQKQIKRPVARFISDALFINTFGASKWALNKVAFQHNNYQYLKENEGRAMLIQTLIGTPSTAAVVYMAWSAVQHAGPSLSGEFSADGIGIFASLMLMSSGPAVKKLRKLYRSKFNDDNKLPITSTDPSTNEQSQLPEINIQKT